MAVWVLIFTIAAPLGLVVCIGEDGHLALEKDHERGQRSSSPEGPANISHAHGGNCSDTSVLLFYGRVRTGPKQLAPENIVFSSLDHFSKSAAFAQNSVIEKVVVAAEFPINYSIGLSTVILIC